MFGCCSTIRTRSKKRGYKKQSSVRKQGQKDFKASAVQRARGATEAMTSKSFVDLQLIFTCALLLSVLALDYEEIGSNVSVRSSSSNQITDCNSHQFLLSGRCNNNHRRAQGASNQPFLLLCKPSEIHPQSIDLPSARLVSNLISHEDTTPPNRRGLSELVTFFGQFFDHMIAETHKSNVSMHIPVPADDAHFGPGGHIHFFRNLRVRTRKGLSPRNELSSYVDGSAVYSVSDKAVEKLRDGKSCRMLISGGNMLPMNDLMRFQAGDKRVNENPALQAIHTLFVREHNRVCAELEKNMKEKSGDEYFDMARRIVVAQIQNIIFYEFVPAILGHALPKYGGYHSHRDASISNEFSTVAFRVGHTLINPTLTTHYDENDKPVRNLLRNLFMQTSVVREHGIDGLLRGAMTTRAAEVDPHVTSEIRNFLDIGDRFKLDLVALNIQRSRDHHIPSYNRLREHFGLLRKRNFHQITKNKKLANALSQVYAGDIDLVDPWIGGTAEDHYGGGSLGELFSVMWTAEFVRMREGNRFHFESKHYWGKHSTDELMKMNTMKLLFREGVKGGTMKRILQSNTNIPLKVYPKNVFFVR